MATLLGAIAEPPARTSSPSDRRRVLVVLTDGESRPFAAGRRGRACATSCVQVGVSDERVFRGGGRPEQLTAATPSAATLEASPPRRGAGGPLAAARDAVAALRRRSGGRTSSVPGPGSRSLAASRPRSRSRCRPARPRDPEVASDTLGGDRVLDRARSR